jgi:hypothetical protein
MLEVSESVLSELSKINIVVAIPGLETQYETMTVREYLESNCLNAISEAKY